MGVLRAVIEVAVLAMFHPRQNLPLCGTIALELVRDDHPWGILTSLKELPKELLGRCFVAAALHQDIEHSPVLIHGPPEIMALPIDREEHFIQVPLVTRLRASASELIGMRLAKFPTPLTDRLIGGLNLAKVEETAR
jgi:hypothetical protein